jgi:hypothetical protein
MFRVSPDAASVGRLAYKHACCEERFEERVPVLSAPRGPREIAALD